MKVHSTSLSKMMKEKHLHYTHFMPEREKLHIRHKSKLIKRNNLIDIFSLINDLSINVAMHGQSILRSCSCLLYGAMSSHDFNLEHLDICYPFLNSLSHLILSYRHLQRSN